MPEVSQSSTPEGALSRQLSRSKNCPPANGGLFFARLGPGLLLYKL